MKMARLGYFSAEEEYARAVIIKEKLLREACRYSKAHGVKFLSIRVESDDHASIHALENNRFRIMDNLVTYIYRDRLMDQEKILFAQARRWFNVVPMKKQDLAVAGDLLVERFKMGHYLADPAISSEKSKAMYRRWLEGKFKKAADNDLFVAKRQNKVVGFSLLSLNTLLEQYTGLKSLHKGLVAVEASSSGCIIALMNAELKKRQDLDFAEFETQTHNYAMLRVMQKLDMQPIRSRYTFHCAL
jgi:hypothetical protein